MDHRSADPRIGASSGIGPRTQCPFTVTTSTSRNTATALATSCTATPRGQCGPSNGGKRRASQMAAGVNTPHTSAPGMLRRSAVRNGVGLVPRLVYHVTCVASSSPHAVQIARTNHQRGYGAVARGARAAMGGVYGGHGAPGQGAGSRCDETPSQRDETPSWCDEQRPDQLAKLRRFERLPDELENLRRFKRFGNDPIRAEWGGVPGDVDPSGAFGAGHGGDRFITKPFE